LQLVQAESVEYEFADSPRSIVRIGAGQTLSMLIQEIYPGHKKLWPQLEEEIKRRNPQAFNRYTGKIIPGQRIQLVTIKIIHEDYIEHKDVVGEVDFVKGYAVATDTTGNERRLVEKGTVYEGDRLTTDNDATLKVKLIDGAELHLKEDSSVRLTEYRLKSGFELGSSSIIDLIKGGLRTLTGAIGANPLNTYRFQTGVMTIGVRGTDYVVKLCELNNCLHSAGRNDGDVRLHVVVLDGVVSLQDEEGVVGELIMGQYAIAAADRVMVNDFKPVNGLLSEDEQKLFNAVQPPALEDPTIWPQLPGGA
jgi:hypothetical protein